MAGKRSKSQRERDRKNISELYLQGFTQMQIKVRLKISQSTVSRDLRVMQRYWQMSAIANMDQRKRIELAKIDNLEREYWQSWLTSGGSAGVTKTVETITSDGSEKAKEGGKSSTKIWEETGDVRYLSGVQWCINKRCEILGINAPRKIAPTDPTGKKPYQTTDDIINELIHIFKNRE